jgi:heat shock transcription factor
MAGGAAGQAIAPPTQENQKLVPQFVSKLYEIVDDPTCNDAICWTAEGTSFVVLNPDAFQNEMLPKYFKHNNFSSFVRQLNLYNFKKLGKPNYWEFKHDYFLRGQPQLLPLIRRKSTAPTEKNRAFSSPFPGFNFPPLENRILIRVRMFV